ncbi:hypothetical protein PoMZ_02778, partial [Pyricularia oryzae]
ITAGTRKPPRAKTCPTPGFLDNGEHRGQAPCCVRPADTRVYKWLHWLPVADTGELPCCFIPWMKRPESSSCCPNPQEFDSDSHCKNAKSNRGNHLDGSTTSTSETGPAGNAPRHSVACCPAR